VTPPCMCDVRRAVAQLARSLIIEVRETLEAGVLPIACDALTERILCSAVALGSAPLAHFLLAADDDQELWQLSDEEIAADAGVSDFDLQLISVCRAWWRWLYELRNARHLAGPDPVEHCEVLLASMPMAWFPHAAPCPRGVS
jgi:hypothetical protein